MLNFSANSDDDDDDDNRCSVWQEGGNVDRTYAVKMQWKIIVKYIETKTKTRSSLAERDIVR